MPQGKSGRMRHYITIEQVSNNIGDEQPTYSDFMTNVPANVYEVRGQESFRRRQLEANVTHVIETRWYDGIEPTMRVKWGGKTIEIKPPVDRTGRKRYMEIDGNEVR